MKAGVEDWGKLHGHEALKLVLQRCNDGWDSRSAREQPKGRTAQAQAWSCVV